MSNPRIERNSDIDCVKHEKNISFTQTIEGSHLGPIQIESAEDSDFSFFRIFYSSLQQWEKLPDSIHFHLQHGLFSGLAFTSRPFFYRFVECDRLENGCCHMLHSLCPSGLKYFPKIVNLFSCECLRVCSSPR